jgi:hypothetical protein
MIKKLTSFASSLKSSMKMGKAPIFLKHRAGKIGSKAKKTVKYIKKNPIKSATIGSGVAGLSYLGYKDFSNTNKKMQKKLISAFGKLPKSDPRYKSLKKAGYI